MSSRILQVVVLTLGLLAGPGLMAADPAAPLYAQTGVIDEIVHSTASIVISDKGYNMPLSLAVFRGNQKTTSLSLSKGMEVGFNAEMGPDRKRMVREIWILR